MPEDKTIAIPVKYLSALYQILTQIEEVADNKQPLPQELRNNLTWHATNIHTTLLDEGINPDTGEAMD